nr:uncharacterized protein LOC112012878 [Quercus suber]
MEQQQQQQLLHFCDSKHPLVFDQDYRGGAPCCGCQESVYGPSYYCTKCGYIGGWLAYRHHKSCAEVPLGLHHPLHPIHPLILFDPWRYSEKEREFYKCELCKEYKNVYIYRCSRCDFNLHITCASLAPTTMELEFHDHPLTPIWKWITFTCDICGKEDKGMPYLCNPCNFWVHRRCAYKLYPRKVKVVRHKHLLHLTHSSLEFHPSDSRFCQICVEKVDTHYGLYYCSRCDFAAHLDCAMGNKEDINLQEFKDEDEVSEHDELVDSATYEVKKFNVGKDGIQIAAELKHFSHDHDLKLTDEVMSNQKCDGCVRDISPPFYSCVKCSFFLHESCAKLPKKKRHPLHEHPLTLFPKTPIPYRRYQDFRCYACKRGGNGFNYSCVPCGFSLDIPCSLILDILTHPGHEHQLILSSIKSRQNCSCCDSNISPIFRCTTCAFALDFKCATLPHTTRYGQHEHAFTLCYTAEDDSGEYYCDICEEGRVPKHWFYYCIDCSYPVHPKCILGKNPNYKFGGAYTFHYYKHLTY